MKTNHIISGTISTITGIHSKIVILKKLWLACKDLKTAQKSHKENHDAGLKKKPGGARKEGTRI
jgi:hypothetical protein